MIAGHIKPKSEVDVKLVGDGLTFESRELAE